MLSQVTVIGHAISTHEDRGALFVVLLVKDTGKFRQEVCCRFYGEAKKYAEKASAGDLCVVHGEVSSREHKGKWYTEFNARYLQVEETGQRQQRTSNRSDPPPSASDDPEMDLPF